MDEVDHNVVDQETIETHATHEAHETLETCESQELHESHDIDNVTENCELPLPEEIQTEHKQEQQHEEGAVVGGGEKKWPGWPGESVFRMLVPAPKVGSIIGRKGEYIKKLVEDTRARIKILDGPPGTNERAVLCSKFKATIQSTIESQT